MDWKIAFAAVRGAYHTLRDMDCQDSCDCRVIYDSSGQPILAAVVSDGAGSAAYGKIGSMLACASIMEGIKDLLETEGDISCITQSAAEDLVLQFQEEVEMHARTGGLSSRDFACTLLAAVVGTDSSFFFHIGDGAIVISRQEDPGLYVPVFWPMNGEYENTTCFASDAGYLSRMECKRMEGIVDKLALFSDGLQRLALHYESRTAYVPFFMPLFDCLKSQSGRDGGRLSDSLASFLNSKRVNQRTGDDKALIIAVRSDGFNGGI